MTDPTPYLAHAALLTRAARTPRTLRATLATDSRTRVRLDDAYRPRHALRGLYVDGNL